MDQTYGRKIKMDNRVFPGDRLYPFRVGCSLCPGLSVPAENMTAINSIKGAHRREHWHDSPEVPRSLQRSVEE